MTRFKLSMISTLVSGVVTAGILLVVDRSRAAEAAHLRDANDRLRFEAGTRRNAAARPAAPASVAPASVAGATEDPPPKPTPTSTMIADYRNEGRATPLAALQTLAWTGDRGDTDALQSMIVFDAAARPRAQAYFDALPSDVRHEVATLDRLAAVELTASFIYRPLPRAGMLERAQIEPMNDGRVAVVLPGSTRERMQFQQTSDGWKYVLTEAMVHAFIADRAPEAP